MSLGFIGGMDWQGHPQGYHGQLFLKIRKTKQALKATPHIN
jgi:hypothetical protein